MSKLSRGQYYRGQTSLELKRSALYERGNFLAKQSRAINKGALLGAFVKSDVVYLKRLKGTFYQTCLEGVSMGGLISNLFRDWHFLGKLTNEPCQEVNIAGNKDLLVKRTS